MDAKHILFLFLIFANLSSYSQWHWEWQNRLPQGNSLSSVCFPTPSIGYAVGYGGAIIKTIDGGSSWTVQYSGTSNSLISVFFINEFNGFVVGYTGSYHGYILRTTDGGLNWADITPFTSPELHSVFFPTADTGYVAGMYGAMLRTTDGGNTWTDLSLVPAQNYFNSLYFFNGKTGLVAGACGILKTTDAGETWSIRCPGPPPVLESIWFTDMNHGYAAGDYGVLLKTTNGGNNWVHDTLPGNLKLTSVHFNSPDTGIISGVPYYLSKGSTFFQTFNAGNIWTSHNDSAYHCFAITSRGASEWTGVGSYGYIIESSDDLTTWTEVSAGTTNNLYGLSFPDHENGFAVGSSGTILKTTDHGQTWTLMNIGSSKYFWDICFSDASNGYIVGEGGLILKTVNGGNTWDSLVSGTTNFLSSVTFPTTTTGYAVGINGTIIKTTNGLTWTSQQSGVNIDLRSVYFTDPDTGFVVGGYFQPSWSIDTGFIAKTVNGGATWVPNTTHIPAYLMDVYMLNGKIGYAVGDSGLIIKTTDGFATWQTQESGIKGWLGGITFIDPLTGYITLIQGDYSLEYGDYLKTIDGGVNWSTYYSGSNYPEYAICFTDPDNGYIVGGGGSIIHTDEGTIIGVKDPPRTISRNPDFTIMPNPCLQASKIRYELVSDGHVDIGLFDFTGKQVKIVLNREQTKGSHEIVVNTTDLQNGIYICRIRINNECFARKIVVIN